RLRQGKPGGLDDDVVGRLGPVQQSGDRRQEVVGDGAADAAVGQLDDVVVGAALVAAAADQLAVDAEVAELVDDEGEPAAAGILAHVPDQAGLAGPEEAGDDGRGNLGGSGGGLRHAGLRGTGYGRGSGKRPNCTRGVAGETP